jgi:hypothetical protein
VTQITFENDETYLPVTLQQFESLTNELLVPFNELTTPQALDGNYFADIVHGAIHQLDRKRGTIKKSELFMSCVNMVSKHITYHAVESIRAALKAKAEQTQQNSLELVKEQTSTDAH